MRNLVVDALFEDALREDPTVRSAYRLDATFHSEMALLRDAASRAHDALLDQGEERADDIIRVLLAGFPDPQAAVTRIADHEARTWALMAGGPSGQQASS